MTILLHTEDTESLRPLQGWLGGWVAVAGGGSCHTNHYMDQLNILLFFASSGQKAGRGSAPR
jgi:hypothetical protein